jgi:hypothetical protein
MDREPLTIFDSGLQQQPSGDKKKPYHAPELVKWGTLAKITQKVGYRGANDGGKFPYGYKTSF